MGLRLGFSLEGVATWLAAQRTSTGATTQVKYRSSEGNGGEECGPRWRPDGAGLVRCSPASGARTGGYLLKAPIKSAAREL